MPISPGSLGPHMKNLRRSSMAKSEGSGWNFNASAAITTTEQPHMQRKAVPQRELQVLKYLGMTAERQNRPRKGTSEAPVSPVASRPFPSMIRPSARPAARA